MRKILVPADGSANAMRAVRHAANMARDMPVELHVLNVQEPIELRVHAYLDKDRIDAVLAEEAAAALRPAQEFLDRTGVRYVSACLVGNVAQTVDRYARDHACEAIVMGTRGMTPLANLALGSVAARVVHLTNVPITLVK